MYEKIITKSVQIFHAAILPELVSKSGYLPIRFERNGLEHLAYSTRSMTHVTYCLSVYFNIHCNHIPRLKYEAWG